MRLMPALVCVFALSASSCSMFGGEKVQTGYVGTGSLDQAQVTQILSQNGYTDITGLHKNGHDWVGSAMNQEGQQVNFDIDKKGKIRTK